MEQLSTKRQTHEHQDNQSFRFPFSTCYFGRTAVRDQLVWVGAARVLAAARFGRGRQLSEDLSRLSPLISAIIHANEQLSCSEMTGFRP